MSCFLLSNFVTSLSDKSRVSVMLILLFLILVWIILMIPVTDRGDFRGTIYYCLRSLKVSRPTIIQSFIFD